MKLLLKSLSLVLFLCAQPAFAATATLFNDFQSTSFASGSATVNFNSYNASSITISVTANAYGASQQGGGRNYAGYAEAVIGASVQSQNVPNGSDPQSVWASNSLTITKGGDGNWYSGGINIGTSVSVTAYTWVNGENAVGFGSAYASISWVEAPSNSAPTIAWNTTPGTVASGQSYSISAHGQDANGNLTQVNVWKNAVAFAFAGGGNGTDNDSGNTTSDTGPTTVTFTAQAVDATGATSATISQTVTVNAANFAPTIAWNSTPGTVASGQSYSVSAHGHDANGNLTQVNVWKNAVAFAFSGGGNGTDNDSGNTTSDTGPTTITFTAQAVDATGATSATITQTVTVNAANSAPTIAWNSTPGTVASGQSYSVSAHGHDANGNLTQVNVWKNAVAFAFAGGGNGTDSDSGNTTSDTGPTTVTFTAQAVDATGTTSATISQTVTVNAANSAPTIAWNSTPGTVASRQSYSISAHGHDANGNLTQVNVWRNGVAFAFAGGGNGTDNDSGNTTSDTGPTSLTFTAQSVDAAGATSATISQTVTVAAPSSVSASIALSPTSATAPGGTTVTWSSANASSVSVSGNGLNSSAASGSQTLTGLTAGSYTYTITAQGNGGPVTRSATFIVTSAASVSVSINASPTTTTAPGAATIAWSSANATSVSVTGNGLSSTATSGSQTVTGLPAGTYDYTITALGPNGPATQTASVVVSAATAVTGAISANPSTGTEPVTATISWSTANASSVAVTGPGISSSLASGSQNVAGLPAGTHTFTLTAQGNGGPITHTAIVTVGAAAANVTGSVAASPTSATAPGATTISWSTANATSVSVTGPSVSSTVANGSQTVSGLAAGTYTYTLTAQGTGGPLTRTTTFTVSAPGPSVTGNISISPTTMNVGGTATLTWSTTNATAVKVTGFSITGNPYESSPNLTVNIGGLPAGTFTYTLVAQGTGGPVTKTATIVVNSTDGLGANLVITPTAIYSNQSASMSWSITGANFKWVHGWTPNYNGVSIYPAPASGSTTLSGLSPGTYGYTIEYGPGAFSGTRTTYAYLTVLGIDRTVSTSVSPLGAGSVNGAGTYAEGASATLTATPDATHVFTGWSGGQSGTANPLTFTVGAQNYSIVANFALRTFAVAAGATPAGAGSVTGAGSYPVGSTATLTATADATHTFASWSGDISGTANPLSFVVNSNVAVVANFVATSFTLTTAAVGGGSVTPGGTYLAGTIVTIAATPDATHRFLDWTGDASGTAPTTVVTLDRAKSLQANFTAKATQTIAFTSPGDHALTSPPFSLVASASSGLPVNFSLLSGAAVLTGNSVEVTGAGPVTVQANQPGDAFYLPAPPANQTFNVIAAATLRYRGQSRTILRDETNPTPPPFVLEKP
ncbi:MAG: hypothetical protein Q8N18_05075 [Opitutaceae bacterium]|nr:hypothetical protein [Opitutaceae bacterium]